MHPLRDHPFVRSLSRDENMFKETYVHVFILDNILEYTYNSLYISLHTKREQMYFDLQNKYFQTYYTHIQYK